MDFRGYVLGLRSSDVEAILEANAVEAETRRWSPIASIALGVPRSQLLRGPQAPRALFLYGRFALLVVWAVFAAVAFFALASFVYGPWQGHRDGALLATLGVAAAAFMTTVYVRQVLREGGKRADEELVPTDFPWELSVIGPDFGIIFVAFVLLFLLALFLLFVVWVPLLFVLMNLITLGELWRMFRTLYIEADADDRRGLRRSGVALLHRGAVLSHGWDAYLDPADVLPAIEGRKRLLRVHRCLTLLAALGLLLAVTYVVARYLPFEGSTALLVAEAAATIGAFAYLLLVLVQARVLRRRARPAG